MFNEKQDVPTLMAFFGKKYGQTLQDFMLEVRKLSAEDIKQLVSGIHNDKFSY